MNRLYNEDNLTTIDRFPDESIDLVITSPPYNVKLGGRSDESRSYDVYVDDKEYSVYISWLRVIFSKIFSKLTFGGRVVINIGDGKNGAIPTSSDIIQFMKDIRYLTLTHIIWNKNQTSPRTAWGSWLSPKQPSFPTPFEHILVFCKGSLNLSRKGVTDLTKEEFINYSLAMWTFPGVSKKKSQHPAAFPEELPYRCIKMFSYIDDIIYDPFAGVGTTLLVAEKLRRNCIGSEISEQYCKIYESRKDNL